MTLKVWKKMPVMVQYIGWNDHRRSVLTDFDLGRGVLPKKRFGIRRMIWDAAFGYINGFRKRDILYFCLTRSMSKRVWKKVYSRNNRRGDNDFPCSSLTLDMRDFCIKTGKTY